MSDGAAGVSLLAVGGTDRLDRGAAEEISGGRS